MQTKVLKQCPHCKKEFISWTAHKRKFCSRSCADKAKPHARPKVVTTQCSICCEPFEYRASSHTGLYCSRRCAAIGRPRRGTAILNNGYEFMRIGGQRIHVHRFLMQQKLGRKLTPEEHVHHIDGNKLNNDISNLTVLTRAQHYRETFKNLDQMANQIKGALAILRKYKVPIEQIISAISS